MHDSSRGILAALAVTLLAVACGSAGAQNPTLADRKATFDIASQPLADALTALARQSGLNIILTSQAAARTLAPALSGSYTPDEALKKLLQPAGLKAEYLDARTVAVRSADESTTSADPGNPGTGSAIRLTQESSIQPVVPPAAAQTSADAGNDKEGQKSSRSAELQEIVVTAQKRSERLIDVPQSVTVLTSDQLARLGATQLGDFADTIPGLSFTTSGVGSGRIVLRGVTTGGDLGPSVGIYVDEVPYSSSSSFAYPNQLPLDAALFDVERVEVLKGPQGTLYGASTMGGLLKYVTREPDATRFGIDVQTGVSSTSGGGMGYNGSGAVNVPLAAGKAAMRLSGYYSHDDGYVDNLASGREDVNSANIYGGRADFLVMPTDAFKMRITAFAQNISRDGVSLVDYTPGGEPVFGSLEQDHPFGDPFEQRVQLLSATLVYDAGPATLTSVSSYQNVRSEMYNDNRVFIPFCGFIGRTCSATAVSHKPETDKFVQEIRLSSRAGRPLEWLVGAFYTRETSARDAALVARDLTGQTIPLAQGLGGISVPSRYEEYAAFGDLTWHIAEKFDVSGGLRYARNDQESEQIGAGLFGSRPVRHSSEDVVTYLVNARYRFTDHATGYVRYATGYRPGGPSLTINDPATGLPIGPTDFEADTLKSYEVGYKAETADRTFGIDLSAYYIDWSNIQILAVRNNLDALTNAPGGANIRGSELTLTLRPSSRFIASGAFAYQSAELSEADADLGGAEGERLPGVPRFTAALLGDYELMSGGWRPTVGATLRHVSDRTFDFSGKPTTYYRLPAYTTVDVRTGFSLGEVYAQVYVHNLLDKRGQLIGSSMGGVSILQPRTIGISVNFAR